VLDSKFQQLLGQFFAFVHGAFLLGGSTDAFILRD